MLAGGGGKIMKGKGQEMKAMWEVRGQNHGGKGQEMKAMWEVCWQGGGKIIGGKGRR